MDIEFQNTRRDFTEFNKSYCKNGLKKRIGVVIILIVIAAISFGGKPFELERFLIGTSVSIIVVFGLYYFVPLLISSVRLNKAFEKDKSGLEKRKLTVTDKGLLIESEGKTTIWNWEAIVSAHSLDNFIYFKLADKKVMFFPKRHFQSDNEVINFLGLVQSKIIVTTGPLKFPRPYASKRPSYFVGLFCLIPVIGGVLGIVFAANGISKYKDKWFALIGLAGVLYNIGFGLLLFYGLNLGNLFLASFVDSSQMQLNSLMKDVEFYKLKNGVYPDSLEQIGKDDPMAWIDDPLQIDRGNKRGTKYNYQKVGNHYYLFSSGIDGKPNTKDDIYPQIAESDSNKFGWIHRQTGNR